MTEEQIKQKAEAYATKNYGEYDEHDYTDHSGSNMCHAVSEKAFIADAYSRNEEIEELQNELESLRKGFYERGDKLKELMLKNNELHHPWISVEDRLPEEGVEVIGMTERGWVFIIRYNPNDNEWCGTEYRELLCPGIAYWMPIPELSKGEII